MLTLTMVEMPRPAQPKRSEIEDAKATHDSPQKAAEYGAQSPEMQQNTRSTSDQPKRPEIPWFTLHLVMAWTSGKGTTIILRGCKFSLAYYTLLFAPLLAVDQFLASFSSTTIRIAIFMLLSATLSPFRAAWTQTVTTKTCPPTRNLWQPVQAFKQTFRTLLLPSLLHATAQAATVTVPLMLYQQLDPSALHWDLPSVTRVLEIPGSAALVALILLLPSTTALNRMEAALLPAGLESDRVIPFDRAAIFPGIDNNECELLIPTFRAYRSIDVRTMRRVWGQCGRWILGLVCAVCIVH